MASQDDSSASSSSSCASPCSREWTEKYPGVDPMSLTPRMAWKLRTVASELNLDVIAEYLIKGELPPPIDKKGLRLVVRRTREWEADGEFDAAYGLGDDLEMLPEMSADRDYDKAEKILLYLKTIREQDTKRSPLYRVENHF